MDKAVEYLVDKINDTNIKNPKANKGCVTLYHHVDRVEELMHPVIELIAHKMSFEREDSPRGTVKLLSLTYAIGRRVGEVLNLGINLHTQIAVGTLFVEAIQNGHKALRVLRDPGWKGHRLRAPYIVIADGEMIDMVERIRYTGDEVEWFPIRKVTKLFQDNGKSLIKRWEEEDESRFKRYLNADFVKAADTLQRTGWRVNPSVLEAVKQEQYRETFFPPKMEVPEPFLDEEQQERNPDWLVAVRHNSKVMANTRTKENAEEFVLRDEAFYYYVDFDFRGRVYYRQPFLHYQGNDLARGLLQFADGRKLDENGKFWLAVHTASSFNMSYSIDELPEWCEGDYKPYLEAQGLTDISVDKMTLQDRANWTREHFEEILIYGEELIITDKAEKPVVFLACCVEWADLVHEWDDHISYLPIPVDGANNGWQHLGAMSKDEHTGELVGLVPVDIPRDFYVKTAQRLKERMPEWFESRGMPMKHIRKGIAKRGSMTKAYSAGEMKIAENMWVDVVKEGFDTRYNITFKDCIDLSKELVKAIKDVCPGPLQTMKYLQRLAEAKLSEGRNVKVSWHSPSGFPITQEYLHMAPVDMFVTLSPPRGTLYSHPLGVSMKNEDGKVVGYTGKLKLVGQVPIKGVPSRQKSASAISPNFVHSQDAAHMALMLAEWKKPFGAVHDSFSVHANDVPAVLELTKQTFVDMYAAENYFDVIRKTILGKNVPEGYEDVQPELGSLNIDAIRKSDFFFA